MKICAANINKLIMILLCFLLLLSAGLVSAQDIQEETAAETEANEKDIEEEIPLSQKFTRLKILDRFDSTVPIMYYRFSPDVMFFDSIDLSYFPHEKWAKDNWALLGRWTDRYTYTQMIYTDIPSDRLLMHGTDTGESRGFLKDFYLYATLFIEDNYPADTGSCYLYYSDSLMIGFKESDGLLIDPESGIYEALNSYGGTRHATYTPNTISHTLEMVTELSPDEYKITADNIEGTSIGASEYPGLDLDGQFLRDWESLTGQFRMITAPEVKAYRVEIIRENGFSRIYINGKEVYAAEDKMKTRNADKELVPERVSWTYGPLLNVGGQTVSCSVGDFIIYDIPGQN